MKVLVIFWTILAVGYCQERTVTQDLLAAQHELGLSHRFFEILLDQNRDLLSNYLLIINREVKDAFMNSYAEIKNIAFETNQIMDDFESSVCKDRIRTRWDLQVKRYGSRLSRCMFDAKLNLEFMTQELNVQHHQSQSITNQVQNQGVNVLTEADIFDARNQFPNLINRQLRNVLFEARDVQRKFEGYVNEIIESMESYIFQLSYCSSVLPRSFANEANEDIKRIEACHSN